LQFVVEFKYLGHIILHNMSDNADIDREIRNMFFRANILVRKFSKCSVTVKIQLFKSFCINLYGSALWHQYSARTLYRLQSCYNKCMKILFGYRKHYSVTTTLLELQLPSFHTVLLNSMSVFRGMWAKCNNSIVQFLYSLSV